MATAHSLVFRIIGDNEQFDRAVKESAAYLDDFRKKTSQADEIIGKAAKQIAVLTTAAGAMGATAVKMAVDYNAGFAQVYTLLDEGEDRLKELQAEVLNLSPAVGKTTDDLTAGLYDVISAFGDTAESTKNLELAAKAATAGAATTRDSVALLSAVTKAYGDTSNEAQKKVANNAFMAVKLGQTTFPELASSIQRVTSQSKVLGISQEELFAVFSSGTGVIGNAAEVSTKYSAVLTELQKPGDRLAKAFKKLGAASGQELIANFGGFEGAMQALKKVAKETGEPISNIFSSAEAGKQALYVAGEGAEKFASDLEKIKDGTTALNTAFDKATTEGPNAFGFQLKQAGLNAKSFAISLGQELIPSMQTLFAPMFNLTEVLGKLDEGQLKAIASIGKVAITALGTTTAIFGLTKGLIGAKKAFDTVNQAMRIANAAFKMNHLGLFVAGVTSAIVAVKQLANWLDYLKNKKHELEVDTLKASSATEKEAMSLLKLADQYDSLRSKQELTNTEEQQLKRIREELIALNPELAEGLSLEKEGYEDSLAALQKYNKEKQEELKKDIDEAAGLRDEHAKKLQEYRSELEGLKSLPKIKIDPWDESAIEDTAYLIAERQQKQKELEEQLTKEEELFAQAEDTMKRREDLLAALKDFHGRGMQSNEEEEPRDKGPDRDETQADRLAKLDAAYDAEKQIIENRNMEEKEKNEALLKAESDYYNTRFELLEKFHAENLAKGISYGQSELMQVGKNKQTILQETQKTNDELLRIEEERAARVAELAEEKYRRELEAARGTAEAVKKQVEEEVKIKKELGDFEGKDDKEKKKNINLYKVQKLREKEKDLMGQVLSLQDSSNEKDREKAAVILEQVKAIDSLADGFEKAAGRVESAFTKMARKVADKMNEVGSTITSTFDGIANIAKSMIGAEEAARKQETNQKLAEMERQKNEALLAIDDELRDMREEKRMEDAEREEARREEEYENRLADANRKIRTFEGQFQMETNLEKIRNKEQQLEEARKKKAEAIARKKDAKEKQKREKEARKQEVELLNARAKAAHDFAVAKIQTENVAGEAAAKAAQETAKWEKASSAISLTIKAAVQAAEAAASYPVIPSMVAHSAASTLATVMAGVVLSQPLPPDYIAQPLPPPPRPIKFASGGIVMPTSAGTGITLPGGTPGLVAEAGVPEMILPITPPNMESLFKAAGVTNNNNSRSTSLTINPSYNITMSIDAADDGWDDKILETLRAHERELVDITEEGRRNWFIGGYND